MVRVLIVALTAMAALAVWPAAPRAVADGDRTVLIDNGRVRCQLSASDPARGGDSTVVCQQLTRQPWGQAPFSAEKYSERMNLAVVRGTGEFQWDGGNIRNWNDDTHPIEPIGQDVVVGVGQEFRANGWTIQGEVGRTRIASDSSGHGMFVTVENIGLF